MCVKKPELYRTFQVSYSSFMNPCQEVVMVERNYSLLMERKVSEKNVSIIYICVVCEPNVGQRGYVISQTRG